MTNTTQTILIGVDGGGTVCRAVIGTTSTRILARATAGPSNVTSDIELAIKNVVSAATKAAQRAGIAAGRLAAAHIGVAGVMTPQPAERVAPTLPDAVVTVADNRPTTVRGAVGDTLGFVLSVGTGAIAAANTADGLIYVGGWGFPPSDHGSGAWLGLAALEQTLLCYDGVYDHSPSTLASLSQFSNAPNAVVTFGAEAKAVAFASLAPNIIRHAQAGVGPHYARYRPDGVMSLDTPSRVARRLMAHLPSPAQMPLC